MAPNFKFGVFYFGEEKENKNSYAKNIIMIGGDIGMIRVRFRTIIIPRGDTGFISFPNVGPAWDGDVAVFSLLDKMTRKTVLEKMLDSGKNANTLVDELGLSQIGNPEEIRAIVLAVMDENKELILDYKNGKRVFDYFIGQVMKKSRGRANPALTSQILKEELSKVE